MPSAFDPLEVHVPGSRNALASGYFPTRQKKDSWRFVASSHRRRYHQTSPSPAEERRSLELAMEAFVHVIRKDCTEIACHPRMKIAF